MWGPALPPSFVFRKVAEEAEEKDREENGRVGEDVLPLEISGCPIFDENKLDDHHLVVKCILGETVESEALIDCCATGLAFVDRDFCSQHNFPRHQLKAPRALNVIDGRRISSGDITEIAMIPVNIGGHRETVPALITKLGNYDLVLGIPCLRKHDVRLRFAENTLSFPDS